MSSTLLSCEQLEVGYAGKALLPPINFSIGRGELCAVVGRNGAGKSTWFRTLIGLLPPIGGVVRRHHSALALGYVPQRVELKQLAPFRARDIVAMGLDRGPSYLRPILSRTCRASVEEALNKMDAEALAKQTFGSLSEGQKQQVLMARLLASKPELAILDEPTAGMDQVAERETGELIERLVGEHGLGVLMVSHNLPLLATLAKQMVFIDRVTQTVAQGPPREILRHTAFRSTYGHVSLSTEPESQKSVVL